MMILVTGGARSGKSRHAEALIGDSSQVLYIATSQILCNFAFFSGLIGAQFWAERAQPKSPELDAKLLVSC